MRIKEGVSLLGLQPQLVLAAIIANEVWTDENEDLCITCGTEGSHKRGSAHYTGRALDLRIRYFSKDTQVKVSSDLQSRLGTEFDVILHKTHVHIEWDPEQGVNL